MIDALVRKFLGTAGSGLLDFYMQFSIWINALLMTYALLVFLARRNSAQIVRHILADLMDQYGETLTQKSPKQIRALLLKWEIPWETGLQAGWFPFIAAPQGFLLRIKSDRNLREIFSMEVLVETIVRQTSSRSK